jgi:hypothetical protein
MPPEDSVIQALVEMADTLVGDFDMVEMLTGLTSRCIDLLGVSAAGAMLAKPTSDLHLVASSNEAMRILELFELQAEEGPCLDAYHAGETVSHQHRAADERQRINDQLSHAAAAGNLDPLAWAARPSVPESH